MGIINSVTLTLFFLAVLNTLRHCYYFAQAVITSTEDNPQKYKLSEKSLVLLGISIAYILSSIVGRFKF